MSKPLHSEQKEISVIGNRLNVFFLQGEVLESGEDLLCNRPWDSFVDDPKEYIARRDTLSRVS